MKILQVNTHLGGGAAKACIRLHQGLRRIGVDSKLLTLLDNQQIAETYNFIDHYKNPIIKWQKKLLARTAFRRKQIRLRSYPPASDGFALLRSPFDITQHHLYREADIIHFHWMTDFLDYPSFFTKNNKPLVWTTHDMSPFTGGYSYEKHFPFESYQKLIRQQAEQKKKLYNNQNLTWVAPSKWMAGKIRQSNLTEAQSVYPIPNSLDTDIFQLRNKEKARQALDLPQDSTIVLFVADSISSKRKGMELLLEATRNLNLSNLLLVVVGRFWNPSGKMPPYRYVGSVKSEEKMALLYNAADVFVIPSLEDNFPNTVIESLCCGTPVAGFEVGGIAEQVRHGVNGYLSSEIGAMPLKARILDVLSKKNNFDRQQISKDAKAIYALELQAKRMKVVYEKVGNEFGHAQISNEIK